MTSSDPVTSDHFHNQVTQDLVNRMTAFEDKPLPPVQQSKPRSPGLSNMNTNGSEPVPRSGRSTPQPLPNDRLRKQSSRMSLFSLFTRPKVEKLRGYAEPGVTLPSLDTMSSRSQSPEARSVQKLMSDKPLPPLEESSSSRDDHLKRRSRVDEPFMGGKPLSSRKRNSWVPPPLFQAYSQSLKASKARTADGGSALPQFRRRTDSSELSFRPEKIHRAGSVSSIKFSTLPKKIFALTRSGHMIQYADQGMVERLPEKILQLKGNSVACACNLVPGEPFVLQIAQDTDAMEAGLSSSSMSLLSRMGFRSSATRKEATCILLVLQNADEMNDWMMAIRKKIQSFRGHVNQLDDRVTGQTDREPKSGGEELDNNPDQHRRDLPGLLDHSLPPEKAENTEDILKPSRKLEALIDISEESVGHGLAAQESAKSSKLIERTSTSPSRNTLTKDVDSDEHISSNDSTPGDSPLSGQIEDPMIHADKVRKQFPFKIRSTIQQGLPSPKPDIAGIPVDSGGKAHHDQLSHAPVTMSTTTESDTRPESILTDLPSFWTPQVLSQASPTSRSSVSTAVEAKQNDPRLRPLRTSEPSNCRRPTMKPLSLPLKINTSVTSTDMVLPHRAPPVDEPPIVKISPETPASCRPCRTSSTKLSLFPVPGPTPSPAAVAPIRSVNASHDPRSLRRPSSLQVRSNPAPFLSSVRSASTTRPALNKAGSASSLRSASYAGQTNHSTTVSALSPSPATSTGSRRNDHVLSRIDNNIAAIPSSVPGQAVLRFPMNSGLPSTAPSSRSATPVQTPTFPLRTSSRDHNSSLTALPPLSSRPLPRASSAQGFHSATSGRGRLKTGSRFSTITTSQGLPALDLGIPVLALAPPEPPPARDLPSLPAPPAVPPKEVVDARLLINAH